MAMGTTLIYNKAFERGTFYDLAGATVKGFLTDDTSNANSASLSTFADITGELGTANGYTAGGVTLANVSLSQTSDVVTVTFDDPTWTPSGGDLAAKFFGIYIDGTVDGVTDPLLASVDLDTSVAAGITRSVGDILKIIVPGAGFLRIGRGTLA